MLPVSLDCLFFIAFSVFSNVFLLNTQCLNKRLKDDICIEYTLNFIIMLCCTCLHLLTWNKGYFSECSYIQSEKPGVYLQHDRQLMLILFLGSLLFSVWHPMFYSWKRGRVIATEEVKWRKVNMVQWGNICNFQSLGSIQLINRCLNCQHFIRLSCTLNWY
jgi:hypothetical protein